MSPANSEANRQNQRVVVKRKVGRPKNINKQLKEPIVKETDDVVNHRTKSGRIVKFKAEVASKIFQLDNHKQDVYVSSTTSASSMDLNVPKLLCGLEVPPKKQRKISSQFRCNDKSCLKIYLGQNKMKNHYKNFPSHRPKSENDSNLMSHLMSLVRQKKTNNEKAEVFFREMSSFVQICEKLTVKLITPENPSEHQNTHHFIDKNSASLLRINPGNYRLNMNVFDKDFNFDGTTLMDSERVPHIDDDIGEILETHQNESKLIALPTKPLIIDETFPSLDGNECSSLLIRQTNELTNLTNISLETEDF